MTLLYERLARTSDGSRRLAVARLKREALKLIYAALDASGVTQTELAERLRVRKSAVSQVLRGDGNLRIKTMAEYLHALGYEVDMRLVQAGEPRRAVKESRDVVPAFPSRDPRSEQIVQSYDVGDGHLLLGLTLHGDGHTGVTFEGSAHHVPKAPSQVKVEASAGPYQVGMKVEA
ncbi:helix-turn-helix domain-containing protein [Phaeacidiphilus oryzae]|uniref:helix-turn-helix domain-containing protein n=1 Tax=Phaeacidiphilus oryzae TaxID=348818 RepID=UPI000561237B|nr:helix-turn-helix transcriptional regulator [Phaeacidiphilus oryzae]